MTESRKKPQQRAGKLPKPVQAKKVKKKGVSSFTKPSSKTAKQPLRLPPEAMSGLPSTKEVTPEIVESRLTPFSDMNEVIQNGMMSVGDALFRQAMIERTRLLKLTQARGALEDRLFDLDRLSKLPPEIAFMLYQVLSERVDGSIRFQMAMHEIISDGASLDRLMRIMEKQLEIKSGSSPTSSKALPKMDFLSAEQEVLILKALSTEMTKRAHQKGAQQKHDEDQEEED